MLLALGCDLLKQSPRKPVQVQIVQKSNHKNTVFINIKENLSESREAIEFKSLTA